MIAAPTHVRVLRLVRLGVLVAVLMAMLPADAYADGRRGVQIIRDVPYGTSQGEDLLLDVYHPPATASPSPMIILIHGGGFTSGDKARFADESRQLALAGFVVFDINYTLDTSGSPAYPRQVEEAAAALAWAQTHADEFGGDKERIAVAGGSAGGYLAAMLGLEPDTPVRAVVSLSGPMDLVTAAADLETAATAAPGRCSPATCETLQRAVESLRSLLGCDPEHCSEHLLREASPITHITAASPPFYLANGTQESIPTTQATRMAAALETQGVPVELRLVPGSRHSVAYVPSIRRSLMDFLDRHVVGNPLPAPSGAVPIDSASGLQIRRALPWLSAATALLLLAMITVSRRRSAGAAVRDHTDRWDASP